MNFLDKVFSGKPSRPDFTEMMMQAFQQAGIETTDQSESDFSLKLASGGTVFLGNVYTMFCGAPRAKRQSIVSEFLAAAASISGLSSIPTDFATIRPSLMPVLSDAVYFSLIQLMQRKNGKQDVAQEDLVKPIAGGLQIGLAYDSERNITTLDREHFKSWGVSLDEAFKAAKENLWEKTDPTKFGGGNGVYHGAWADSYDSSRMLLTELIYRLSVDGDPVVFVPNRDQFWITGTNNSAGLAALLKGGMESHFKQDHPLSPDLYALVDGTWKVHIPGDPALRELWMKIKRQRDAIDYAQQQKLLNEIYELEDIDIFVASYKVYERKDGLAYSACVWTDGVDSSLPRSENIALMADVENPEYFVVPWEATESVIGDMLELEPNLVPVRYRARQFPSEDQLAKLRPLAL
jgi:hypothetical protein